MAVETNAAENLERLSSSFWAIEDVSFLPHGFGDDQPDIQPIWLSADGANPNAAAYRFYVDGALPVELAGLDRALLMIDSNSEEASVSARSEWKKRKAEGHVVSYWKQDENGRWVNMA